MILSSIGRDLQAIVYRYLYDLNYTALINHYRYKWLSGMTSCHKFNDKLQVFEGHGYAATANSRDHRAKGFMNFVYLFDNSSRRCELPENYFYSIEDLKGYLNL